MDASPQTDLLRNRTFDELAIGERASLTRTASERDIALFAAVSGDINPAHMDPRFAATDRFGHIVLHGMWTAALVSAVLGTKLPGPGTIYLGQELHFRRPVRPGDAVTATVEVVEKDAAKGQVRLATQCATADGTIVLSGIATVLAPRERIEWPAVPLPEVAVQRHGHEKRAVVDLTGRRGLVIGIANEHSLAYGCARAFADAGAQLAVTWLNDKARPFVEPLAQALGSPIMQACDVGVAGQLEAVFDRIAREWGGLDFLLHAVAFAPRDDLHGLLVDCSAEGMAQAMDVSCHSFLRCARLARPLMRAAGGGSLLTLSYHGADRVVEHYNLMGPVKAALEASVRALAVDLAPDGIRAHALSTGPVATRAASGIEHFDELIDAVRARTPGHQLVSLDQIGRVAAFLASEAAAPLSGSVTYADAAFHVTA